MQLFAGKLASCGSDDPQVAAAPTADACAAAGGVWANPYLGHFDSVGPALLLLFESATMEGWPDVMYAHIDATTQGHAPSKNASRAQGLYMVVWTILGGMFLINVFVGVIVDAFAALKRSDEGLSVMDADQEQWVDTMKQLLKLKPRRYPPEPSGPAQAFVYRLINQPWFEPFVLGVILFNTGLMGMDGLGGSPEGEAQLAQFVYTANVVCTGIFVLEAALKIYALSFAEYIREAWNVFDFSVAGISVVAEVGPGPPSEEHAHAPSCARASSHGRGAWACARGRWSRPSPPS